MLTGIIWCPIYKSRICWGTNVWDPEALEWTASFLLGCLQYIAIGVDINPLVWRHEELEGAFADLQQLQVFLLVWGWRSVSSFNDSVHYPMKIVNVQHLCTTLHLPWVWCDWELWMNLWDYSTNNSVTSQLIMCAYLVSITALRVALSLMSN